jgi:hypothetical protein
MKTKNARGIVRLLQVFSITFVLASCTVVYHVPLEPVECPQRDKIDLKVALCLTEELRNAKWEKKKMGDTYTLPLGEAFSLNAEMVARALFSNVLVTNNATNSVEAWVDTILTPRMVSVQLTRPLFIWEESKIAVIFEWSLKDVKGDIIWVDTITGVGKGTIKRYSKDSAMEAVEMLLEDLFQKSFQVMSSSMEIRRFADKPVE